MWVQLLGQEDPLEQGMETLQSILAWRIPMDRGAQRATVHGVAKSQTVLSNSAQHGGYNAMSVPCLGFKSSFIFLIMAKEQVWAKQMSSLSTFSSTIIIYESETHSVISDSLRPHELQPARLLYPRDFPDKNTRAGYQFLLQGIFLTQGLNLGVLHGREILYHLSHQGSLDNYSLNGAGVVKN